MDKQYWKFIIQDERSMEQICFIGTFIHHIFVQEDINVEVLLKVLQDLDINKLAETSRYTKQL